jgi:hypothetical protein
MTEIKTQSRVAQLLESFDRRAHAKGRTVEEEVKLVIARREKFTPEEALAVSRYFRSLHPGVQPSLTLDEIREGLM